MPHTRDMFPLYCDHFVLERECEQYATWFYNPAPFLVPIEAENMAMAEFFCERYGRGEFKDFCAVQSYDEAQNVYWVRLGFPEVEKLPVMCIFHFGWLSAAILSDMQDEGETTWSFPFLSENRPSIQEKPTPQPQKAIQPKGYKDQTSFYILFRNTDLRIDFHSLMDKFCGHYNDLDNEDIGAYAEMYQTGHHFIKGPYGYEVVVYPISSLGKMFPSMLFEFGAMSYYFMQQSYKDIKEIRPIVPDFSGIKSPLQRAHAEKEHWEERSHYYIYRYLDYEVAKAHKKYMDLFFANVLSKYDHLNRPLLEREKTELDTYKRIQNLRDPKEAWAMYEELKNSPMDSELRSQLISAVWDQRDNLISQMQPNIEIPPGAEPL